MGKSNQEVQGKAETEKSPTEATGQDVWEGIKMILPTQFNYVAAFLTFSCQLKCGYCINHHGHDLDAKRWMPGEEWISILNKLELPEDLPITLQGGEPTAHRDFYKIVNGIRPELSLDLLTNLEISPDEFMFRVGPERFKRKSPYSSIRVSYHKGQSDPDKLLDRVKYMQDHGFHIGIWGINHPEYKEHNLEIMKKAVGMGIDFRLKEFLGEYNGKHYGTLRYPDSVDHKNLKTCECTTTELLIDPIGNIFRCHSDLYANREMIGNMKDEYVPLGLWRKCYVYGLCNSCDVKIKTNRFQEYGHSSVEVRNVG